MSFVAAAITAIGSAFGGTAVGGFLASNLGRLLVSTAVSALSSALQKKPRAAGLRADRTLTGEITPAAFVLGRFATFGSAIAPEMSHGKAGKTPNAYLTYIIALADRPGHQLESLWIDGEEAPITAAVETENGYGNEIGGAFEGRAWIKYYDGTQTAADAMLLAKYGDDPDRPWTSDMVGQGLCYAILTFRYDREVYSSFPEVRFELTGAPLYDPRKDGSAGGTGAHRWDNPATWEVTDNPVVMIYNIMRGIEIAPGRIWGGRFAAADFRLSDWFAAMNACDVIVTIGDVTEPRYRAGWEVQVTDEPADVIDELLQACAGQLADVGGEWRIRAHGPGLPVYYITDDNLRREVSDDFRPFPPVEQVYNGITVRFPAPGLLYEMKEAPPRLNATWEAEDGGRRLLTDLTLSAVPYRRQAQRLGLAMLRDHRRMRAHTIPLNTRAIALEPLDVIGWTSEENGYIAKAMDIQERAEDLFSGAAEVAIREKDPSDYDFAVEDDLPDPVSSVVLRRPPAATVPSFAVTGAVIEDDNGTSRRPAILMTWDASDLDDVEAIEWELRRFGATELISSKSTTNVLAGRRRITSGILPNVAYQVRARLVVRRRRSWTEWLSVTAPDVRLAAVDLAPSVTDEIAAAKDTADEALAQHAETIRAAETEAARLFRSLAQGHVDLLRGEALHHREQMNVRRNGFRAAIIDERAVRVTEEQALAAQLNSVQAQIDASNIASVTELQTAIATLQGHVAATYSLRLVGGGASAAFEIVASDDPVEGPASSVFIKADNIRLNGSVTVDETFWADKLFVQEGWLTSAMIGNAQITSAKIANAAITSAKIGDLEITRAKIGDQQIVPTYDARAVGSVEVIGGFAEPAITITGVPHTDGVRGMFVSFSCEFRGQRTSVGTGRLTIRVSVLRAGTPVDVRDRLHDLYFDAANTNRYQAIGFEQYIPASVFSTAGSYDVSVIFLGSSGVSGWASERTISVRGFVK